MATLKGLGAEIVAIEFPELQSGRVAVAAADLLVYEFREVFG